MHFRGINIGDELEVSVKERSIIVKKTPETIFPEYYLIRVKGKERNSVSSG